MSCGRIDAPEPRLYHPEPGEIESLRDVPSIPVTADRVKKRLEFFLLGQFGTRLGHLSCTRTSYRFRSEGSHQRSIPAESQPCRNSGSGRAVWRIETAELTLPKNG